MDISQSENKDCDDSMKQKPSPVSFKETIEAEGPENETSKAQSSPQPTDDSEDVSKTISATNNDETSKEDESKLVPTGNSSKFNKSDSKTNNAEPIAASTVPEAKAAKRKRTVTSDNRRELSIDVTEIKVKRAKTKSTNDAFCWRCHKESVDAKCRACPRSWHRKCIGGPPLTSTDENWICGECATILKAENAETRSEVMAHLSIDHLCMLLKYIVERMRSCQGAEPFRKAVDLNEVPNYMDYVVRPMDLDLLETNIQSKLYGSTDAFMADAKWIQHNCIVFNTCGGVYADTSKLTNAARQIIKIAKQEVAEIEACADCYVRGRNLPRPHPSWFIEACRKPHPLIWAKLKGFPFWPAKAMPRVNSQGHVDVRFFGQHDRAWVALKDVFLYSREPPSPLPRKRRVEMAECIKEVSRHSRKLELAFGPFQYAPPKTPYNPQDPMQIKLLLPHYDPSSSATTENAMATRGKSSPSVKRFAASKKKSDVDLTTSKTKDEAVDNSTVDKNLPGEENPATSEIIADSVSGESAKQKKRQKKSATVNNDQRASTTNEEAPSPMTRLSIVARPSVNKTDDLEKSPEIINGTSPRKNIATPDKNLTEESETVQPIVSAPKPTEKPQHNALPLVKSLTGLLRTVNTKGRCTPTRKLKTKVLAIRPSGQNNSKLSSQSNSPKSVKTKTKIVEKTNDEEVSKSATKKTNPETELATKNVGKKSTNDVSTSLKSSEVSQTNSPTLPAKISVLHNKRDNNIIISNSVLKVLPQKSQTRILVVNNGTVESTQLVTQSDDVATKLESSTVQVKQEPIASLVTTAVGQRKSGKAKKSFPNDASRLPQLLPKLTNPHAKSLDTMVYIPAHGNENGVDYELPKPEAGPLSAQINRGANELAKRMGQLLEEAVRLAAESNVNERGGETVDNHQATIHSLRLQIERMRWQHQQQLTELKHNTDRTLREMRASLEAERLRVIEEIRREAEEERTRCVDETKTKQWCAHCGREALFYCCWNTAYCDYLCQQAHWQAHQRKCAQKPSLDAHAGCDSSNQQQQVTPTTLRGPRGNWYNGLTDSFQNLDTICTDRYNSGIFHAKPDKVTIILKETEMFFLFEMPQLTEDLNTTDGLAIKEANERYEYITTGPGSNRKLMNTETQTPRVHTKSRSTHAGRHERRNFGSFVNNWVMHDTYAAHHKSWTDEDEHRATSNAATEARMTDNQEARYKFSTTETILQTSTPDDQLAHIYEKTRFREAVRVMERIIAGNLYIIPQKRFKNLLIKDPYSLNYELTYTPDLLWTHSFPATSGREVTCFKWNPVNENLLVAGYGPLPHQNDGIVLIWCSKNPNQPDRIYHFDSPISDADWSKNRPNQLAIGFYDGSVRVIDISRTELTLMRKSSRKTSPSYSPHWQVQWWPEDEQFNYQEQIYTANQDGRILCYRTGEDFTSTEIMRVPRIEGNVAGTKITNNCNIYEIPMSRNPGALLLRRHPNLSAIYFVGTEEGCVNRCSTNYLHQHIDSFVVHDGPIYSLEFSPFCSKLFLTCGADWCTRIWADGIEEPLVELSTKMACVRGAAWCPTNSTVLACIVNNEICMWDIKRKTYRPTSITVSPKSHRFSGIGFTTSGNRLVVSDVGGNIFVYTLEGMPFPAFDPTGLLVKAIEKTLVTKPKLLRRLKKIGSPF